MPVLDHGHIVLLKSSLYSLVLEIASVAMAHAHRGEWLMAHCTVNRLAAKIEKALAKTAPSARAEADARLRVCRTNGLVSSCKIQRQGQARSSVGKGIGRKQPAGRMAAIFPGGTGRGKKTQEVSKE